MAAFCDMGYNVTGHVTGNISLQDCHTGCQEAILRFLAKKCRKMPDFATVNDNMKNQ